MAEAMSKVSPLDSHSVLNFNQARLPRQFSNAMTTRTSVTSATKMKMSARNVRQLKMRLARLIGCIWTVQKRQSTGALQDAAAPQGTSDIRGSVVECGAAAPLCPFDAPSSYRRLQQSPIASRKIR